MKEFSMYEPAQAQYGTMSDTPYLRHLFLQEVDQLINGDRAKDYGDAQENFQRIANLWASYKNTDFTAKDVAIMLGLLKISRLAHTPDHKDSWIDLAGYAALGGTLR